MPGEVSPRADRETQESEFYFTDHSLTGQSTSFLHCWLTSHNPRRPFFYRSHFDWRSSVPGVGRQQATCRPQVGLSGQDVVRKCSPSLFHRSHLDWEQESFRSWHWESPARRIIPCSSIAKFFCRMHFDWWLGTLPSASRPSPGRSVPRTERTNFFLPIAL